MCGIAGAVNWGDGATLAAMIAAQRHRGPDDSGVWERRLPDGSWLGLANRRLAIIDLSPAGHMPMHDPDSGLCITYNGEIYNFAELRAQLEAQGVRFRSHSDTEVVLRLYQREGEQCLTRLRGMFAFAIVDERNRRVFIARDPLGIKPLYYAQQDCKLLFASEVRSLLESGLIPRTLNEAGLLQYLAYGSVYDPETIVAGVSALPPGHSLTWANGQVAVTRYARLDGADNAAAGLNGGGRDVVAQVTARLEHAAYSHMVSDVPVGVFLSGGIDSSALVAILSRRCSHLSTFSIVFEEDDYSEARYSRLVARTFATDHHETQLSQRDCLEALPDAIRAMDQPTIDGVNSFIVAREVHRAGLKVALSGLGGDELFAGYAGFRSIPRVERPAAAWRKAPSALRRAAAATFSSVAPVSDGGRKLTAMVRGDGVAAHPYIASRTLFTPSQLRDLLRVPRDAVVRADEPVARSLAEAEDCDAVNRVSYLELRNYLPNTLLRDTDAMSMAHSLEVRVPFLDLDLLRYLLSVPGELKLSPSTPKHLLVKAAAGLPDEIVYRRKQGFSLPFQHWLRQELRPDMEQVLCLAQGGPLLNIINREAARKVWDDFLRGRTSWSRPWSLYVLARWCEVHGLQAPGGGAS